VPQQPAVLRILEGIGGQLQPLGVPERAQFDCASAILSYILGLAGQYAAGARLLPRRPRLHPGRHRDHRTAKATLTLRLPSLGAPLRYSRVAHRRASIDRVGHTVNAEIAVWPTRSMPSVLTRQSGRREWRLGPGLAG